MLKNISEIKIDDVINSILKIGEGIKVWTLTGNLGSGKTTLTKAILSKMGISDQVQSPTFSYVNIYDQKIFHFDCYRLKSLEEALDFGIEEYLDSGKLCLIEWPEVIEELLPKPYLSIEIAYNQNDTRNYTLNIIK
ncbi:MAG: tRNA (adenosine(37)-N6)-threonylcarbamoyltransferase complex ATPase subunit type 1 TsaE [Cytophagaceae bacterium]|nr:tRNA (adenosine(37)-N6)-threonylcarbamoyltransferase complex ATPase subunit type 1 TsaE [Cytophagaceae bacterium]MBK9508282.1 tRNA (adenosine(37)-N6)-threonylcarbamoyltransferase complex ATPase subunit type 1 TsaE [Cytophagaceae bacterium]MBK9933978.1 tRNA (adenosine(37)-N6)-threonylcarbamoyltransferase complex ATPase subunit type 1 TsaE [Cytophagaceae bacterium]MBL0300434.1 tRNA (adenosine(37)-N6)-threonylcarbamoyltransferase complex ATPase subunit type 1 TsaE [Cytophagaceae bacterium]MBL03